MVRGFRGSASRYSARIEQAAYPTPAALQYMCIGYRCSDVLVPQEFLHRPNVVAVL